MLMTNRERSVRLPSQYCKNPNLGAACGVFASQTETAHIENRLDDSLWLTIVYGSAKSGHKRSNHDHPNVIAEKVTVSVL